MKNLILGTAEERQSMRTAGGTRILSLVVGVGLGVACTLGVLSGVADAAGGYPNKPITVFNSSVAGSPTDVMARQVAQYARKYLGQPMVVVNKPGGGGGVMFAALFADPADGYTIASLTGAQVAALHTELKKDFSFENFDFIANVQREPNCLAVKADGPFKTLRDMIEYARKNPSLKVGGQGTGSALHLMVIPLAEQSGTKLSWVPFGGGMESVTNLLGDTVPVISTSPATVNQYVEAKQIRILAITGDKRMDHLKEVPTFKELGYDIVMFQYRGFAARKGLPPDAKAKLVDGIRKAIAEPGFKEFMTKNFQPEGFLGPEEFTALARADFDLMGQLLQKLSKTK
jgi:tripartite-type tricarboxylate transporter receptor subunit TctC